MATSIAGLPGGNRNADGTFNNLGKNGNWWSSSENTTDKAWNRNLNYNNGNANRNNNNKGCGFSVRCVRDLMETKPRQQVGLFTMKKDEVLVQLQLFESARAPLVFGTAKKYANSS